MILILNKKCYRDNMDMVKKKKLKRRGNRCFGNSGWQDEVQLFPHGARGAQLSNLISCLPLRPISCFSNKHQKPVVFLHSLDCVPLPRPNLFPSTAPQILIALWNSSQVGGAAVLPIQLCRPTTHGNDVSVRFSPTGTELLRAGAVLLISVSSVRAQWLLTQSFLHKT